MEIFINTQDVEKLGINIALYKAYIKSGFTRTEFFKQVMHKSTFYRSLNKLSSEDKADVLKMESRIHDHIQNIKEEILEKVDFLSEKVEKIYDATAGKEEKKVVSAKRKMSAIDTKYAEITNSGTQEQKIMMHTAIDYQNSIAKKFGNKNDYTKKKVVEAYDTIRLLVESDSQDLNTICNVLDFILVDEFWNDKVKALSSLRTISKNGQKKYFNVFTAMNNAIKKGTYILTDYLNSEDNIK